MEKILNQLKEELDRLIIKYDYNLVVSVGLKAWEDGNFEQWIEEINGQIQDNEPRVVFGTSYTIVFLIKKYKANGKITK